MYLRFSDKVSFNFWLLLQFGWKNRKHRVHYVGGIRRLNTKMEHRDTLRVLADIVQYSSRALGYLDRSWNLFRCHVYQIKDSGGLLSSLFLSFFLLLLLKSLTLRFDKLARRESYEILCADVIELIIATWMILLSNDDFRQLLCTNTIFTAN